MFRHTTLRRLLVGGAVFLALTALLAIAGLQALNSAMQRDLVRQTRLLFEDQRTADGIVGNLHGQLFEASRFLSTRRPELLVSFRHRGTAVYSGIRYYLFRDLRQEERLLVERIKEQHQVIEVTAEDAFNLAVQGRAEPARLRTEELLSLAQRLELDIDRLVKMRMQERAALLARHSAMQHRIYAAALALAALFVGSVLLLSSVLRRRLLEPLAELSAAAARLGRGDLGVRLPMRHGDELAAVAGSFNGMAAELELAHARAAAAEARFRELVQGLDAIVWEQDLSTSLFTFVSQRAEVLLGYPVERWLEVPGFRRGCVHPDDLPRVLAARDEALLEGRDYATEYRAISADGAELWFQDQVRVVAGADGLPHLLRGVMLDITARRRAAEQLASAEAHYRRLVETSPYGIFALNGEGRCTEANPALAEMFGRPPAEVLGMHFSDVVMPDHMHLAERSFADALAGGTRTKPLEVQLLRPDGERRLIQLRASAVHEGGRVAGTHGVVRDITVERELEHQLRRAERLATVGTLVGGVAHELNNPLASIKSYAQLLLLEELAPELRDGLELMQREADRAARVVADLRTLARDTQKEYEKGPVELAEVVQHVLRLRQYELATHNVQVHLELEPGLPRIWGDRTALEQVLLNLLVNAEQAMSGQSAPAELKVSARAGGRGVVLEVSDTGPGIAPGHLDDVFDAFWTTKAPGAGMGLGLSLVQTIVTEHGGSISVESAPGRGAAFRVELPRSAAAAPPSAPARLPAASGPGRRVLVVDDEESIRKVVARYLARRGHQVTEASDGAAAIERVAADGAGFDRILADLRMPGMDGEELFTQLQVRGLADRLVFVTGDAVSPDAARILAATGAPVVHKPFRLDELAALVEAPELRAA